MTRKHYEAIARTLRKSGASDKVWLAMADTLSKLYANFDAKRFLEVNGIYS